MSIYSYQGAVRRVAGGIRNGLCGCCADGPVCDVCYPWPGPFTLTFNEQLLTDDYAGQWTDELPMLRLAPQSPPVNHLHHSPVRDTRLTGSALELHRSAEWNLSDHRNPLAYRCFALPRSAATPYEPLKLQWNMAGQLNESQALDGAKVSQNAVVALVAGISWVGGVDGNGCANAISMARSFGLTFGAGFQDSGGGNYEQIRFVSGRTQFAYRNTGDPFYFLTSGGTISESTFDFGSDKIAQRRIWNDALTAFDVRLEWETFASRDDWEARFYSGPPFGDLLTPLFTWSSQVRSGADNELIDTNFAGIRDHQSIHCQHFLGIACSSSGFETPFPDADNQFRTAIPLTLTHVSVKDLRPRGRVFHPCGRPVYSRN